MKRLLRWFAGLTFAAIVIGTGAFLYMKSQKKPVIYQVVKPVRTDIIRKTVATGAVVPRKEVLVKPLISGIIDELYVEAGQPVKEGDLIARVRVIPNMVAVSSSESRVNKAKISLDDTLREYERNRTLAADGTISTSDFQKAEIAWQQAQEELKAAQDNLEIVRKGTSQRAGSASTTLVKSTLTGMVLEVPLEVGNSVIEANNFNDGTTIAAIADMDDMIFEGKVDESEVGKIRAGMPLELTIGAMPELTIHATLEHIAPKGIVENGAIQFEIRAAIEEVKDALIRANYSASANIVLEKRENVLAIDEGLLQFDEEKTYVEIETAPQQFERRDIETGISDGIQIEVVSGLTEEDMVKNPNPDAPIATAQSPGGPGGRRRQPGALGAAPRPRRAT